MSDETQTQPAQQAPSTEPATPPDPTALDAIEAAGLKPEDIAAAHKAGGAAPSDPMETRMTGLELRVETLERRLREAFADKV